MARFTHLIVTLISLLCVHAQKGPNYPALTIDQPVNKWCLRELNVVNILMSRLITSLIVRDMNHIQMILSHKDTSLTPLTINLEALYFCISLEKRVEKVAFPICKLEVCVYNDPVEGLLLTNNNSHPDFNARI
jgi:hypothetical protein